jgi:hypothetical protein
MAYVYKSLASPLHATADAAIAWFIEKWGLAKGAIKVEEPIDPDVNFRPTFSVLMPDFNWLAIEVKDDIYTSTLDSFVLDCRNKAMPVKLFVAVQKGGQFSDYPKKLKSAKRAGVGILEVDGHSGEMLQNALSLSLSGVRAIELKDFPSRYRQSLQQAEQAFRDGQPAKASSLVYDELENFFRRFAKRCAKKKWCPDLKNKDVTKGAWATLITKVDTQLDRNQQPQCKNVTRQLLARIFGITPHRNDTGHKPHSLNKRMKMERELSTRFEGAVDLFKDFHTATKSLHL